MSGNFQNQVIWITGASSGIGEAVAYAFAREGARLILSARRADVLAMVKEQCAGDPNNIFILPLDLADLESLPDKAQEAYTAFGRIDILFNNGGIGMRGSVLATDIAVQQRVMQVNYFGQIALTKAVLPFMLEQKSGRVVVVTSLTGKLALPGRSAYVASKHALHGFFDTLRAEVWRDGIRVTIIAPGFVRTRIAQNALLADGKPRDADDDHHIKAMSADKAAQIILNAIRKGKEEVYFGGIEYWAVPIHRHLPWLYHFVLRRLRLLS